ncbi:MAG TPA: TonB-dependent receptor [Blastocatellia bacterium]|nr:TonB-dependent receptor [Blastocatellia bacterium]
MTSKGSRLLMAIMLALMVTTPALPQSDVATATIKGTVTDQNNAVVVGATVTAKSVDKGTTRLDRTNSDGNYQIPSLQPGAYELRVEATGFQTHVLKSVEVTVGKVVVLDVQMSVGAVTNEIQVTTDVPLIETERTQQANTIERRQVENLPNIGRDFTQYVFILPGVSSSSLPRIQNPGFTFGSSGFSIGGSNGRNNLITMDGGENEYGSGQLRTNISVEAIQEFQVNRNAFAAEFGFTAGTAVNVVTKGGTNSFHGSGFVFYRNQSTGARNFFDFRNEKAPEKRIYPGGTFGGPIIKNKAFFFTSFERQILDTVRFRGYTDNPANLLPTLGQSSYLATLDASASANIRRIATDLRRNLTTTNFSNTMKLLTDNEGNIVAPDRLNSWTTRVDYQIGSNDSLSGRFSLTHNDTDNLLEANTGSPSASTFLIYRDYTAVGTWTHNFGTSVVNTLRTQFVPNNSARTIPKAPGSTSLIIAGVGNFGRDFAGPFNTFQDRYQFEDNVTWVRGAHSIKFGGSYRPVNYRVINELWFGGEWQFLAGALPIILAVPPADRTAFFVNNLGLGLPGNGPATANQTSLQTFNLGLPFLFRQGFGNAEWQDWGHYVGLFVQDSWKVSPKFTLDFGVRYDYDREPAPLKHKGYASPRLGFAWDPKGNQKTVIRGGAGVFYSPVYYQVAYVTNLLNDSGQFISQIFKDFRFDAGAQNPVAIWAAGIAAGKLPFKALTQAELNSFGIATAPKSPGRVIFDADPNYKNNYAIQASLGISRMIRRDLSLDLAYQMYRGIHIQVPHEVNYVESPVPSPTFLNTGPNFVRIDPTITQNNIYKSIGNSVYHGLTASLTKRFSNNFQFQANYTLSKAIDDNTDFNSAFAAFIPTRLDLERALSAFDIRQNFVVNGIVQLPFKSGEGHNIVARAFADTTITPIMFLRTGIPFTVRFGRDVNGDTHSLYDRPFRASRNSGRGDSFFSLDMRVTKQFFISRDSGVRIDFITEGTNLTNHTNFLSVNDVLGVTPDPGVYNLGGSASLPRTTFLGYTSASAGRRIQFGFKVGF